MDADENVDDRLGFQAGDGGAADVMDAALDPAANRFFERFALKLEATRPPWIRRDENDRFVRWHPA
jgi:hypothetical protein